jgi:ATP-dependent helicase HepA
VQADAPNLVLETIFLLETVADSRWHVDQFLAPTPVRIVVDLRGNDLTDARDDATLAADFEDDDIHRFLERPSFNPGLLKRMITAATEHAETRTRALKVAAEAAATTQLEADLRRLIDLKKLNDHVRPEEIALAREQLERTRAAIEQARVRLDAVRLVIECPAAKP